MLLFATDSCGNVVGIKKKELQKQNNVCALNLLFSGTLLIGSKCGFVNNVFFVIVEKIYSSTN